MQAKGDKAAGEARTRADPARRIEDLIAFKSGAKSGRWRWDGLNPVDENGVIGEIAAGPENAVRLKAGQREITRDDRGARL